MAFTFDTEIRLHSVINDVDSAGLSAGEPEITDRTCPATLSEIDGGALLLSYSESEEGGRVDTEITLYPTGQMRLLRRGGITSEMSFALGQEYRTLYAVGPYKLDMIIKTKRISSTLTRLGGKIELLYSMTVGGAERLVKMKIEVAGATDAKGDS